MQAFRESFRKRDAAKPMDLRDEVGNRVVAGRRNSQRRMASDQSLRQDLAEDLVSLFNTVNLASSVDLDGLDHVRRSILNYGLDDLSTMTIGSEAVSGVGTGLHDALVAFEPRLVGGSVNVARDTKRSDRHDMKVRFDVKADMHATPVDVPLDFVAELEVDSAKMKISKL